MEVVEVSGLPKLVRLLLILALGVPAFATTQLTVSTPSGTAAPSGAYIRADLVNCLNPTIVNSGTKVNPSQRFYFNLASSVTFTVPDNVTQIACSGNQLSFYTFTYVANGVQTSVNNGIGVELNSGTFNLANLNGLTSVPFNPGVIQGPVGPSGPVGPPGCTIGTANCNQLSSISVLTYGADPTGLTDSTVAIRNAVAAGCALSGANITLPAGKFVVSPQTPNDVAALSIPCDNITLQGAGMGATTISRYTIGDTNPDTTCPTTTNSTLIANNGSNVLRGAGIYVVGPRNNIALRDFTLNGNRTQYTNMGGSTVFPATTSNCYNVWELSDKGLYLQNDQNMVNISLDHVEIENFSAELFYGTSQASYKWSITNSDLHNSNGDAVSATAEFYAMGNKFHDVAANAIENQPYGNLEPQIILGSQIYNVGLDGIGIPIYVPAYYNAPPPVIEIANNSIRNVNRFGITMTGRLGYIHDNIITDTNPSTYSGGGCGISLQGYVNGGTNQFPQNITVRANTILADSVSTNCGMGFFSPGTAQGTNLVFENNRVGTSSSGVTAGVSLFSPMNIPSTGVVNLVESENNYDYAQQYFTQNRSATKFLLSTTSPTTIVTMRPVANHARAFVIPISVSVTNATTAITATLSYSDTNGTRQTISLMNGEPYAVGDWTFPPVSISAQGADESQYITLTLTAGTANNVTVTAAINEAGR